MSQLALTRLGQELLLGQTEQDMPHRKLSELNIWINGGVLSNGESFHGGNGQVYEYIHLFASGPDVVESIQVINLDWTELISLRVARSVAATRWWSVLKAR